MDRIAIYAGTFDPITRGHLDLMNRSVQCFDRLILAVAQSTPKKTLFTLEERLVLARECTADRPDVEVDSFDGLLVDYVRRRGARNIIRGLRAFSDFEYEFQMALTNRKLAPDIETLFLMPKEEYSYVSSSIIRQIAEFGGDPSPFVPPNVLAALKQKLGR